MHLLKLQLSSALSTKVQKKAKHHYDYKEMLMLL